MLFARTLRRKLLLGVGLVLGMLLLLSVSGIYGLSSYQRVIRDLDHSLNRAPQRTDLVDAIVALAEPLHWRPNLADTEKFGALQTEFNSRLAAAREHALEFRRRLEDQTAPQLAQGQRPFIDLIDEHLDVLEQQQRALADVDRRAKTLDEMTTHVSWLATRARKIPDPVEGLNRTLKEARGVYRSSLTLVWASSAIVVLLFLGLLRFSYVGIFHPIHQLHQGAQRVALGNFGYRVNLKTRDEMAELAQSFNDMTARFQEIRSDLDRQVQERSRQLVRSERLAGVGFLAAGVAHEINNPLSAIAMAAESLDGRLQDALTSAPSSDADVARQYLKMIQDESFRCKEITTRLLDFSRGRDGARESIDLTRLVAEVVAMVQHLSRFRDKHIVFSRTAPCQASVNGGEIKQVVLNLVANGLEAMSPGGRLTIDVTETADVVQMTFRDEGCGMTEDVLENVFEPFFTRKQSGQGTGLGLSISHRIVTDHGGTITAQSAGAGQGSTFTVRLPRRCATSAAA